jgi:cytochrome c-type biogenesis protein
MLSYGLSFLAGVLTALSPCVLPALPLIVGSAAQEHRKGPLAVAAGLIVSFTILGVLLSSVGSTIGIETSTVRSVAAVFLILCGAVLLSKGLQGSFTRLSSPLTHSANRMLASSNFSGIRGQFLLGALLGAVWTPCVGPTLGAAIGFAAQGERLFHVTLTLFIFGVGAAIPLLGIAYASRTAFISWRGSLMNFGITAKPLFGTILVVIGGSILFGLDKTIEAGILEYMPEAWLDLTTRY